MENIITLSNNTMYSVVQKNKETKKAILKQVSNLSECIKYGGSYTFINGRNAKHFLTLDSARELFFKN